MTKDDKQQKTLEFRNIITRAFMSLKQSDSYFEYLQQQTDQHKGLVKQSAINLIKLGRRNINDTISKFRRDIGFEDFDELSELRISQDDSEQLDYITACFAELPKELKNDLETHITELIKKAKTLNNELARN